MQWTSEKPTEPGHYFFTVNGRNFRLIRVGMPISRYGVVYPGLAEITPNLGIGWNDLPEDGFWLRIIPPPVPSDLLQRAAKVLKFR